MGLMKSLYAGEGRGKVRVRVWFEGRECWNPMDFPHIEILLVEIFQHAPFCTRSLVLMIPFQSHEALGSMGAARKWWFLRYLA